MCVSVSVWAGDGCVCVVVVVWGGGERDWFLSGVGWLVGVGVGAVVEVVVAVCVYVCVCVCVCVCERAGGDAGSAGVDVACR